MQVTTQALEERLRRLNQIGIALSVEQNLDVLLDRILVEARRFTSADAGTLYLVEEGLLHFAIAQNDTLGTFVGGGKDKVEVPPVPMDRSSVSGYVALTGQTLNIADVYHDSHNSFSGPKQYDQLTGYRTQSMLVVPMRDHENHVIGVLQLLNATDANEGRIIPFSAEDEDLLQSLASQAAVAITTVRLIGDTEGLFTSFVKVMATALDERFPHTSGHIRRVAELTLHVAEAINEAKEGTYGKVSFSAEELNELRVAGWLHDIGKITTPESVLDKPTKLSSIFDRIELLRTRFSLISRCFQIEYMQKKIDCLERGEVPPADLEKQYRRQVRDVELDFEFLRQINLPGEELTAAAARRLEHIAEKTYIDSENGICPYLTANEVEHLSIHRGSLTEREREKIKNHAAVSIRMLEQIPFTRKLSRVAFIAGAHHENLDGSGYPRGLRADQIPLQARILALVDIFESLSASDRPYRTESMTRKRVLEIMRQKVEANHIDRDIFDFFVANKLYLKYDELKAGADGEGPPDPIK